MGCVSSKVMTRSRSFQEELSLSLRRRTNGMPGLDDVLASKNGGGDQLLALLCTANTVAAKLRSGSAARGQGKLSSQPTEAEHDEKAATTTATAPALEEAASPETINAWELMADLDQEEEEEEEEEQEGLQPKRQDLPPHPQETTPSNEAAESVARSRSFRTVEDFDAMVAVHSSVDDWLEESHGISSKDSPPTSSDPVGVVDSSRGQDDEEEEQTRGGNAHQAPEKPDGSDCSAINVKVELGKMDPTAWSRSSSTRSRTEGNGVGGSRSFAEQKGLRRRAMARELRALNVPSFEFSTVGSLREWLGGGGQVFSPGSYVTPKFGSVGSQAAGTAAAAGSGDAGGEEAPFDPQLVADLEEAMERMTMEEEHILKQIVDSLQGSHEQHT